MILTAMSIFLLLLELDPDFDPELDPPKDIWGWAEVSINIIIIIIIIIITWGWAEVSIRREELSTSLIMLLAHSNEN